MSKKRRKRSAVDTRKKEEEQRAQVASEDVREEPHVRFVTTGEPLTMKQWLLGMLTAFLFLAACIYVSSVAFLMPQEYWKNKEPTTKPETQTQSTQ